MLETGERSSKKEIQTMKRMILLMGAVGAAALAGPPLICQKVEIGNAKSLPWTQVSGWNGFDARYDLSRTPGDTLAILVPGAPMEVRMETIRRAAVYSVKKEGVAEELMARLLARAADAEAAGKPEAMAWFDAGYFAEALRQMAFIARYDPTERARSKWHGDSKTFDGKPWMERAVRLGAKGTQVAFAKIEDMRRADLNPPVATH